uniref:Ubiquitin-like domain-containing protein n=1 Tax=Chenopodium quinoa TaxID=63459 RepID=A0A803LU50_CHEQI
MSEIKMNESSSDPTLVEILLKTIGPTRPSRLKLPPHIKARDLRKLVAENKNLQIESLKLIFRGNALHDSDDGDDVFIRLADGEGAACEYCDCVAIQDNDSSIFVFKKFQLPESTSRWKRRLFRILHDKLKLPDIILIAIFSLSIKAWALIILWFIMAPVAHRWDLGPLYILGTGFFIIFWNLGHRQSGELSAYSIFNEDFRELPGTLNADRLDRDLRTGQL